MKISSKRQLEEALKSNGFAKIGGGKHEKWSNGTRSISVPRAHSQKFSIMLAKRLLKEAKIA